MGALFRDMRASLHGYWTQAYSYQKFLYVAGALLLASALFHTGVLLLTHGTLEGDVSWRKPILFGESFGLTAWSISWFMTFMPRRPVLGWLFSGALGLANLGEVFLVTMQQWRGVPSHFNNATSFDEGVFVLMGLLIQFTGVVSIGVTLLSFFSLRAPASVAWAIRCGALLLVAGQLFGIPMIARGTHTFGAAGNLKIPHALALHAAQILPLVAWVLLFSRRSEEQRTRIVVVAALGYTGLVAVASFQAFRGLAPLDLSAASALVSFMSLALFLAACLSSIWAAWHRPGHAA